ncbi:hypothetical protein JOM56_011941 [Amanita muscaria]
MLNASPSGAIRLLKLVKRAPWDWVGVCYRAMVFVSNSYIPFSASMGCKTSGTPIGSPKFAKDEDKGREKEEPMFFNQVKGRRLFAAQASEYPGTDWQARHYRRMRKKGDKYVGWKARYFILSGHHLCRLKSNLSNSKMGTNRRSRDHQCRGL